MRATVTAHDDTTILRLTPGKAPRRKLTTSTQRARSCHQRRIAAGRCRDCGRKRKIYKQRCNKCQARERKRHRKYGHNFKTLDTTFRKQGFDRRAQAFLKSLSKG